MSPPAKAARDTTFSVEGSPVRCDDSSPVRHELWPQAVLPEASLCRLQSVVQSMRQTIDTMLPVQQRPNAESIQRLALQAVYAADQTFSEAEALVWADGFVWPAANRARDLADFLSCAGSLSLLAATRQQACAANRFSADRARQCLSVDNPHLPAVLSVACGVPVFLREGFIPSSAQPSLPALRLSYVRTKAAVDRAFFETHGVQGMALVLPVNALRAAGTEFTLSAAAWAPKHGKVSGRPITDGTACSGKHHAINGVDSSAWAEARWGAIHHPSIDDIARLVVVARLRFPGEVLYLWAMDISGAYSQLFFAAASVAYMAVALSDSEILFFLSGIFGWSAMPFAFDPITRALRFELQRRLLGTVELYCDDVLGVSPLRTLQHDLFVTRTLISDLMGPFGVADHKTRSSTVGDAIGYTIDTVRGLVSIARKNVLRALYGFMLYEAGDVLPITAMERLASWGSRYSNICIVMKPFTAVLFASIRRAGSNRQACVTVDDRVFTVIRLFRALLALTVLRDEQYTRSITSFALHACTVDSATVISFDASLTGVGIIVYRQTADGRTPVGAAAVDLTSLALSGSEWQNTAEFIAAIFGVRVAIELGLSVKNVVMEGDSVTALQWAWKWRVRGTSAINAAVVWLFQAISVQLHIAHINQISSTENWRCDMLSRGSSWRDVVALDESLGSIEQLHPIEYQSILSDCDPRGPLPIEGVKWWTASSSSQRV